MDTMKVNPFHITDVKALKINGTEIESTADELDQFTIIGKIVDVSTSASSWVVSPYAGTIETIYTMIEGALATADGAITFEIGGDAVTGGAITIAYDGSAAGDLDTSTPTALNTVAAGGKIEILTSGAPTNTVEAQVIFVMQRS